MDFDDEEKLFKNHGITSLIFEELGSNIWSNKTIVLEIIKNVDGHYLKFADEELKRDKEIVYEAVKNHNRISNDIFNYADEELKRDKFIILKLIEEGYDSIYLFINEELKKDRDYTLKLLKLNKCLFKHLDEEYKQDNEMIKEGLKDLDNIEYIENLTDEMILEMFENNKEEILEKLNEEEILKRLNRRQLKIIKKGLENKVLVIKLIKDGIDIYKHLGNILKNDKEIIKYSMIYLNLKYIFTKYPNSKSIHKYKYINDLMENKYEYNYEKIIKNLKYILEMKNRVEIINKLIEEDIKRIKSEEILIKEILDDEGLEEIFRERGVHFVEIIDVEDKNIFIDEMKKKLKSEIIFYEI